MQKKQARENRRFLFFALVAVVAGIAYLLWGQYNSAQTLFDLGFYRYRAAEQLSRVEAWAIPETEADAYAALTEQAEAWAQAQAQVSGAYTTESAAAIWGDSARLTLDYTLYGAETGKTAILLHGFCESDEDALLWASFWQEQGYRVLVPMLRGYAEPGDTNYVATTYGAYEQFDLYDLIMALGLERETVVIHAKGAGAAGALLLAGNEELADAGVDAIVAESVYDNLGSIQRALVKQLFGLGDNFVGRFLRDTVGKRLGFEMDSVDLCAAAAANSETPVLFLCASEDGFLGAGRTEAVFGACASEKQLRHLNGAYRTLWLSDGEAYRAAIAEFLG